MRRPKIFFITIAIVFLAAFALDSWGGTIFNRTYVSDRFGFSFNYPTRYFLTEKEVGDVHRTHWQIMLVEDTQENRDVLAGNSPGREGPIAITVDLYQNNLDNLAVLDWIQGSNDSNFKLGDGTFRPVAVSEKSALAYRWSGLYEGETYALIHGDEIMAISVTFLTPEDQIRTDFASILRTFAFN